MAATDWVKDTASGRILADDWSIYFNYAARYHSSRFSVKNIYRTINWPPLPSDWSLFVDPQGLEFENYYPFLYKENQCFSGMRSTLDRESWEALYSEKIRRIENQKTQLQKYKRFLPYRQLRNTYSSLNQLFPGIVKAIRPGLVNLVGILTNRNT